MIELIISAVGIINSGSGKSVVGIARAVGLAIRVGTIVIVLVGGIIIMIIK